MTKPTTRNPLEARQAIRAKSASRSARKSRSPEASVGAKPAEDSAPRMRAASTRVTESGEPSDGPLSDGTVASLTIVASGSDIRVTLAQARGGTQRGSAASAARYVRKSKYT